MTSPTYSQTSTHTPKPSDKINRNTPLALPAPCFVSDENLCGPAPDRPASGAAVERVLQASCAWCGTAIEVKPRGRRPRFCSQACRQRDYELRTAAARYGADVAAGRIHQEPAERVIERTVLAKHPTRPADWEAALAELAAQVFAPTYALGVAPPGAARFCVLVSVAALRRSALPTVRCRTGSARGGWMTGYRCQDCGREFGVSRGWIDPVALARPPGRRPHPPTRCARWSPSVLAFLAVRRDFFSFRHSSTVRAISRMRWRACTSTPVARTNAPRTIVVTVPLTGLPHPFNEGRWSTGALELQHDPPTRRRRRFVAEAADAHPQTRGAPRVPRVHHARQGHGRAAAVGRRCPGGWDAPLPRDAGVWHAASREHTTHLVTKICHLMTLGDQSWHVEPGETAPTYVKGLCKGRGGPASGPPPRATACAPAWPPRPRRPRREDDRGADRTQAHLAGAVRVHAHHRPVDRQRVTGIGL